MVDLLECWDHPVASAGFALRLFRALIAKLWAKAAV
jgi:hypothetical protein